jgi:hypothetical protein
MADAGGQARQAAQLGQARVHRHHVKAGAQRAQHAHVLQVGRVVGKGAQEHAVPCRQVAQQVVRPHLVALVGRVRHAVHQIQQVGHVCLLHSRDS